MRLLDTRKLRIDEWLNRTIADNCYADLRIVTGFLYQRGWSALKPHQHGLVVRTISSVHVDKATKGVLGQSGHLPATDNLSHQTKFVNEITQHAKLFLLSGSKIGKPDVAIIGSSNLTGPGLGIGNRKNLELNYIVTDPESISELSEWFESLWGTALDASQVELKVDESQDAAPPETYFAQLLPGILTFADIIQSMLNDAGHNFKDYSLVSNEPYQLDAVEQIDFRLQKYGCCFLSDDVGLGKTIMGSGIIKRTLARSLQTEAKLGQLATLLICPQQVQGQWATHISKVIREVSESTAKSNSELIHLVHIATYGQERSKVWSDIGDGIKTSDVKLVLVDEAHRLRNTTNFYRWLSQIDADLRSRGSTPSYLFLTATPINNSFMDLYNLFRIALPTSFWQESGIDGIQDFLRQLDHGFSSDGNPNLTDQMSTFRLALSRLMIRRDVEFLSNHYSAVDLARLRIPKIDGDAELIRASNTDLGRCAPEVGAYLERSMFYPYRLAIAYEEMHSSRIAEVQANVSHVLRAHLSKSIQSSFAAGIASLGNIINRCKSIMDTGERSAIARLEDDFGQDSTDGQVAEDELQSDNIIDQHQLDRMKANGEKDIAHLESFANFLTQKQELCDKEKAESLIPLLDKEYPTLVFTEYRATAKWLIQHLKKSGFRVFEGHPDLLANNAELQEELLGLDPSEDSPRNTESPNYDVYVLTDKYSEGKNFHKCRRIVNYDLPWNPIRKTQRQGRIIRVGSLHDKVRIYSLSYTHTALARYANPEEVLREKLRKIAAVFGKGNNKDLLDEGNKFISYFVRYNKAALGGDSKSKVDSLGIMDQENEATYFYTIWEKIEESGYIEQVRDVLQTWQEVKRSRDRTFVINDKFRSIYAAYSPSRTKGGLQWFEIVNQETKKLRLEEVFSLNVDNWRIEDRINESGHHEVLVHALDKDVARILQHIKRIVAETRIPKNVSSAFTSRLNSISSNKPFEFFNSLKSRLSPLKGNKVAIQTEIDKIVSELQHSQSTQDQEWVVLCTERFAKAADIDKSA